MFNLITVIRYCTFVHAVECVTAFMVFFSRVNVGGKVLTNHLKEVISYRYLSLAYCTLMFVFIEGGNLLYSNCLSYLPLIALLFETLALLIGISGELAQE